jgi:hypothetical protein
VGGIPRFKVASSLSQPIYGFSRITFANERIGKHSVYILFTGIGLKRTGNCDHSENVG